MAVLSDLRDDPILRWVAAFVSSVLLLYLLLMFVTLPAFGPDAGWSHNMAWLVSVTAPPIFFYTPLASHRLFWKVGFWFFLAFTGSVTLFLGNVALAFF